MEKRKKTPEIRFPEFTEDWKQQKLGDVLQFQNGFNGGREAYGKGTAFISVMDILNNQFITYDCIRGKATISDKELERFSVQYGDVLFQRSSENVEDAGTSNVYIDTENTAIFGGFVIRGRQIAPYNPKFMKYLLDTKAVRNQITKKAQGAQHVNVSQETLKDVKIYLPSEVEQTAVENCLCNLDNLITLHQYKCEAMREYKKGLLQKMFPKKDEKVPEIRFPGFADDWEQRKLIEICDYVDYRGKTPTKTEDGVILVTAKNVKDGYIDYEASKEYISDEDYEEVMHRGKPELGDVLITTEAPCGNVAQVNRTDIALAQRIIKYRGHENIIDNTFLKHYLLAPEFQTILMAKSSGGTVKGIKGSILHQQEVMYPKYEEQIKIGSHLDKLDNLITLHQRKCDAMKKYKKGLLQKMFI